NQTAQDWRTRGVTLSPSPELRINSAKGLGLRFFAALRMTFMKSLIGKCTNVLHAGTVRLRKDKAHETTADYSRQMYGLLAVRACLLLRADRDLPTFSFAHPRVHLR